MTLSYSLRLLSLSFAAFFLLHTTAGVAVWVAGRPVLRLAERTTARSAARLLFWIRMLPTGIGLLLVAGVCAPSYLRFENNMAGERVGPTCLAFAVLGATVWAAALIRGLRSLFDSLRFTLLCRRTGSVVRLRGAPSQLVVIRAPLPFLVQSGVFHPRMVISQRLLADFSPAELDAALGHERAHWASRDNWKRLLISFLPGGLPLGPGFGFLERAWAKFTERAADDAVSAGGWEPALSLAAALLRLARLRGTMAPPLWIPRSASSLAGSDDLPGRIQRLLSPPPVPARNARVLTRFAVGIGSLLVAGSLVVLVSPVLLSGVHEALELLLH